MDIKQSDIVVLATIQAASLAPPLWGPAVDVQKYGRDGVAVLTVRPDGTNAETLDVTLQHSENGVDGWEAVPGQNFAQIVDSETDVVEMIPIRPEAYRKYVRIFAGGSGVSTTWDVTCSLVIPARDGRNASQRVVGPVTLTGA